MLNEQTITTLNSLKLFGMARGFSERLDNPSHGELSHSDFVGLLVQDEKTYRDNKRLERLLKKAKLRQPAALEDIDYTHARGLSKQVMLELANTLWIDAHRNILITGPTGIGKSYIACALGNSAARAGHTVFYTRAPGFLNLCSRPAGMAHTSRCWTGYPRYTCLLWMTSCLPPWRSGRGGICWKLSRAATMPAPPSSAVSVPSRIGTRLLAILPWPTPFVTGSCTMPIGSHSKVIRYGAIVSQERPRMYLLIKEEKRLLQTRTTIS